MACKLPVDARHNWPPVTSIVTVTATAMPEVAATDAVGRAAEQFQA